MRRQTSSKRGQTLVESALVLVTFVGLMIGCLDVGLMLFMTQSLTDRCRNAVRWGIVNETNATTVRNLVLYGKTAPESQDTSIMGLTTGNVTVSYTSCPGVSCTLNVTVSGYKLNLFAGSIISKGASQVAIPGPTIQVGLPSEVLR